MSNLSTLGQSPPPRTAMVCLFISLIMSDVVQVSCHECSSHIDFTVFFQIRKNRSNFFDNTRLPYLGLSLCPVSCTCVEVVISGKRNVFEILSLSIINSQLWNQGTGESYFLAITSFLYVMSQYLTIPSM